MDTRYQPTEIEPKMYELWEKSGAFRPRSDFEQVAELSQSTGSKGSLSSIKPSALDQSSSLKNQLSSNPYPVGVPKSTNKQSYHPKPFSIILPPPNANDPLHMGHAMYVVEDVLIRYHRMLGDNTLWLPGTDHAGIETQYVFEKKLQKNGESRFQYDRQTLYQKIWDYTQENSSVAVAQLRRLGFSLDWSRFRFTLDPAVVEFVQQTFFQLHQDKLIYRDLQLVNYCPKCGTSYSQLEVTYKTQTNPLYYIKYGPLVVATVRPETKLGDVALAVHPNDKRYRQYIGQTLTVRDVLDNIQLPVIADTFVDPEFGTGVVKITPAHDLNDFWAGKKHRLPTKQVITTQGKMAGGLGKYSGLSTTEARKLIVEDLKQLDLIDHIDMKYSHSMSCCYRCGKAIEPLPLPQFFLKVKDSNHNLVDRVTQALDSGETKIHGAGREQILRNWLNQLADWNISRQIVWGIRIPVWYQTQGFEELITVGLINKQGKYQSGLLSTLLKSMTFDEILQGLQLVTAHQDVPYELGVEQPTKQGDWLPETDTFDTWFSSSQWPIVTLKTTQPADFNNFYPTSVMETAYDILLFWVMRMMLLGKYLTDQSPFTNVYLHGLIRDEKGLKMSKSKGNVVNPLEIVDKIGADALRLALVIRSTPGQDKSVGEADFKAARNLTNKVWNAARYVIMHFDQLDNTSVSVNQSKSINSATTHIKNHQEASPEAVDDIDRSHTTAPITPHLRVEIPADQNATTTNSVGFDQTLTSVINETTTHLNRLRPGQAADAVVDKFWHWYCDQIIEQHKTKQVGDDQLLQGLVTFLTLLHPFISHLTEAIWQELFSRRLVNHPLLITAPWPSNQRATLPIATQQVVSKSKTSYNNVDEAASKI